MFNLITRVFDASAGSVRLLGRELTGVARHDVVRHGIARTFQNIELFEGASVLDNLMLGRHCAPHGSLWRTVRPAGGAPRRDGDARSGRGRDRPARAGAASHEPAAGLPYGIRKIVELGRALVAGPTLLLIDEPASGLNDTRPRSSP